MALQLATLVLSSSIYYFPYTFYSYVVVPGVTKIVSFVFSRKSSENPPPKHDFEMVTDYEDDYQLPVGGELVKTVIDFKDGQTIITKYVICQEPVSRTLLGPITSYSL